MLGQIDTKLLQVFPNRFYKVFEWKEPFDLNRCFEVQPSGRLEESEVGVGGLHFGWIFLFLLQLVSNLITVLFQASIYI